MIAAPPFAPPARVQVIDPAQVEAYLKRLAEDPANFDLLREFYWSCLGNFNEVVVVALAERLATPNAPPATRVSEHLLYAFAKERAHRLRAGLSVTNGRGLEDTFCRFTDGELLNLEAICIAALGQNPGSYSLAMVFATSLVARGMIAQAESLFKQIRPRRKRDTNAVTSFDPAFHETLEASSGRALREELPPVRWIRTFQATPARTVFVSGDYGYFQTYGWLLVSSFRSHNPHDIGLALHIMDMTEAEADDLAAKLSRGRHPWCLSTEWTGLRAPETTEAAREYYHAVRFARLYQMLESHPSMSIWQVDMDELFNGPPAALFELLEGADISVYLMPARMEPRNKIAAHMLGVAATPAGRSFVARVAGYIAAFQRDGMLVWGVDQVALFAVLVMLMEKQAAPRIAGVPAHTYDESYGDEKILWCAKVPKNSPDLGRVSGKIAAWLETYGPA